MLCTGNYGHTYPTTTEATRCLVSQWNDVFFHSNPNHTFFVFFLSQEMCGVAVDPACKENNHPSIINQQNNKYKDVVCVTFVKSVRLNATYYLA